MRLYDEVSALLPPHKNVSKICSHSFHLALTMQRYQYIGTNLALQLLYLETTNMFALMQVKKIMLTHVYEEPPLGVNSYPGHVSFTLPMFPFTHHQVRSCERIVLKRMAGCVWGISGNWQP